MVKSVKRKEKACRFCMAAMLAPEHDFQQIRICPKTELALHPQTGEFANRPTRPLRVRRRGPGAESWPHRSVDQESASQWEASRGSRRKELRCPGSRPGPQ